MDGGRRVGGTAPPRIYNVLNFLKLKLYKVKVDKIIDSSLYVYLKYIIYNI